MVKLNNSPVRTCKNFHINEFLIDSLDLNVDKKEFHSVKINKTEGANISNLCENEEFLYGIGLEDIANENANKSISISAKGNEKACLEFNLSNLEPKLVLKLSISLEENSNLDIVIKVKESEEIEALSYMCLNILAKENSNLTITVINYLGKKSDYFASIQNKICKNAEIKFRIIDIGAKTSVYNYYSDLAQENAKNTIDTIYIGENDKKIDLNYLCDMSARNTISETEVLGALKDKSKKNFKGTINFKEGAKGALGSENEFCFLLSKDASSISLPMLLCKEEDVSGNHSSASGSISKEMLFYLMTRGFSKKEATKMIIKAKFSKIIDKIEDEDLKNEITSKIYENL